ncbi:hypothetical protein [Litorisediminicola beolgyonensis]|uniref:Tail tape measure protein n=1 Tax=Litorisediminicola beolgyonensis TaxID=1173614 RepID=A0ABW3ZE51_9RHOB
MDEERLIVALEARIRDFERNMARAERTGTRSYQGLQRRSRSATAAMERDMVRSTNRINQALATTSSRIGAFGKAFIAGTVATGVAALTTGASSAVRSLAEIEQQAKRAGLSVQAFQELKFIAEQNRIDVGAMVDGLKELQLRADEFIVTGAGPASEAFRRLGFDATDLKRRLEDPSELFLELVDRMEGLDRAAQIRVADEVFGGTGGERFVELLSQGDEGLRRLAERANELGIVMDAETIAKAAELDRKFAEVQARVSSLAKTIVVELATSIEDAFDGDKVGDMLSQIERMQALLGEDRLSAVTENQALALQDLEAQHSALVQEANEVANAIDGIVLALGNAGFAEEAMALFDMAQGMRDSAAAFQNGQIDAESFRTELETTTRAAGDTVNAVGEIDGVGFGNVIARIGGLISALAAAADQARITRAEIAATAATEAQGDKVYSGRGGDPRLYMDGRDTPVAPGASLRPKLPSVNASFGQPDPEKGSGSGGGGSSGGGGGGSRNVDGYAREVERMQEEVRLLEMEAAALVAAAESGREYGDAIEYAKTRAKLLFEAQQEGKDLTPELTAEIDKLALSLSQAGTAADDAADRLQEIEDHTQKGAQRMSDLFLGIATGAMTAREAVIQLLLEIAKIQFQKAILGLADSGAGGGFFEGLGSLLSFDGGGWTGNGPRTGGLDGKGGFLAVMHPRENVEDTTKPGAGNIASAAQTPSYAPPAINMPAQAAPVVNVPPPELQVLPVIPEGYVGAEIVKRKNLLRLKAELQREGAQFR